MNIAYNILNAFLWGEDMAQRLGILGVELNDPLCVTSGVDTTPRALRCADIHKVLKQCCGSSGLLFDHGDVALEMVERVQYYQAQRFGTCTLLNMLQKTKDSSYKILSDGQIPVILGGDMLMSLGTVEGIGSCFTNLGLICFDAQMNLCAENDKTDMISILKQSMRGIQVGNTPNGLEACVKLTQKISPVHMVFIGVRDYSRNEILCAKERNIRIYTIMDVEELGISKIIDATIDYLGDCDGVHLSFDFDCMEGDQMPGIVNPVSMGLTSKEVMVAMNLLYQTGLITSAEFYGIDSCKDYNNQTGKTAVELIGALFGSKSL